MPFFRPVQIEDDFVCPLSHGDSGAAAIFCYHGGLKKALDRPWNVQAALWLDWYSLPEDSRDPGVDDIESLKHQVGEGNHQDGLAISRLTKIEVSIAKIRHVWERRLTSREIGAPETVLS